VAPYYLAGRISQTLGGAVQLVTLTQNPLFTQQIAAADINGAKFRMGRTICLGMLLYLTAILFLYFGSPPLVRVWVGPGQYVGRDVLLLVTANFLSSGLAVVPGQFVLAWGSNPFALMTLVQGTLTVLGVIFLCPKIDIAGAPLSMLVAGLLTNYWYFFLKGWQLWRTLARMSSSSARAFDEREGPTFLTSNV